MCRVEPIQLYDYQIIHLRKLQVIFARYKIALDYSKTGDGKTYVTSALASLYTLPLLIISMNTVLLVWDEMKIKHGIDIYDKISYETLRGRVDSGCKNLYLKRFQNGRFVATQFLKDLINKGVFIVFDEISKMKNMSTGIHKATYAIINEVLNSKSSSRVLLLSAMPCDNLSHVFSLMRSQGVMRDDKIFTYHQRRFKYYGLQEVLNWCSQQDLELTSKIAHDYRISCEDDIYTLGAQLYSQIVAPRLSSCMIVEREPIDIRNGYYNIDPRDLDTYNNGTSLLRRAIKGYKDDELMIDRTRVDWGMITMGLKYIGKSKLRMLARLIYHNLTTHPTCKVVVGCWYISHIEWMKAAFQEFGAMTLYGDIKMKERQKIINLFQEPNLKCRVMIVNPTVGGIGINLDDRYGQFPRRVFLIPDYRLMDSIQFFNRVDRSSTKSRDEITARYVYVKNHNSEIRILSALLRKSVHARVVIFNNTGLLLPDEYNIEEEGNAEKYNLSLPPLPED